MPAETLIGACTMKPTIPDPSNANVATYAIIRGAARLRFQSENSARFALVSLATLPPNCSAASLNAIDG